MKRCENCMWAGTDQCDIDYGKNKGECSYYPINEEVSDEDVRVFTEEGRKEYADAWNSYIKSFYFDHIK